MSVTISLSGLLLLLALGFVVMPCLGAYFGFKLGLHIDIVEDEDDCDDKDDIGDWFDYQ